MTYSDSPDRRVSMCAYHFFLLYFFSPPRSTRLVHTTGMGRGAKYIYAFVVPGYTQEEWAPFNHAIHMRIYVFFEHTFIIYYVYYIHIYI